MNARRPLLRLIWPLTLLGALPACGGDDHLLGEGLQTVLPKTAAPLFAPAATVPVGQRQSALATADFDGDGSVDLVAANIAVGTVARVLNDGAGGFSAIATFPSRQPQLSAIVAGDFDNDGKPDVVAAGLSQKIFVRLNDGHGGLGPERSVGVSGTPRSLVTGDFNRDGRLDIAIASQSTSAVQVLFGDGKGGFPINGLFAVESSSYGIATADLNGDGTLDIVVTSVNVPRLSVLLGDGAGGFAAATSYATGSGSTGLAVADLSSDGHLDLAVANSNDNSVSVLLGDGKGSFAAAATFATGLFPYSVVAADFNGDGKLDLATADVTLPGANLPHTANSTVSVLLGDGAANFGPATAFHVDDEPWQAVVADFNHDGKPDIATANYGGDLSVLLAN